MLASRLARSPITRRLTTALLIVLLSFYCAASSWSQSTQPQAQAPQTTAPAPQAGTTPTQTPAQPPPSSVPQQPDNSGTTQVPGAGVSVQNQPPQNGGAATEQPQPETRITKAQAKELFRSVDDILRFASQDTDLFIESKVKRNLITRESVEKYVAKRMKDDKDEKRVEQSKLVLQKFGFLPPGYDLHAEFLHLMAEQVAAYYDPKTQSVNLLDWVQPDAQKSILAHELTHALQDQKIGIQKWEQAGAKDDTPLPDQQEYSVEEAQAARQCVAEGQAQIVWFDYALAPLGKSVISASEYVDAVRAQMGDSQDSPIFAQAPIFLKESLMMPYTFGFDFERTVLANRGKDAAFAGVLENPPVDTRQIMQPETYLLHQVVAPPTIPDLDKLVGPGYERVDFGSMGEFDVYLLAKQYGVSDPPNYYRHWRGGYYFATHPKNAPKDRIAMLYWSHWDSPEAALDFSKIYADYLPKRYQKATLAPAQNATSPRNVYAFDTNEGKALIEVHDSDVLILENYDDSVIERARGLYFYGMSLPAQSSKGKS